MNAIPSGSLSKPSFFLFTLGTPVLFRVLTFPAALLPSAANSLFNINFSVGAHAELTSAPGAVASYSHDLAERLEACRDIAQLLVWEQRCWHRELINAYRPDPRIYSIGDIVFARRAT